LNLLSPAGGIESLGSTETNSAKLVYGRTLEVNPDAFIDIKLEMSYEAKKLYLSSEDQATGEVHQM